ncbi:hypothetical protein [Lysinibacillus xylanilyticus]|uniref:hypothetical protein n=1 Tax=Lysinibacillus xylanilyticus TaxID=582475 RepID=UPI003D000770
MHQVTLLYRSTCFIFLRKAMVGGRRIQSFWMHGYNEIGTATKTILTENKFKKSGLTSQECPESLQNHYNNPEIQKSRNPEIQKFKGDLHVINSDGKGKLIKKNVTPAQAWEETKKWVSQKGHPFKYKG